MLELFDNYAIKNEPYNFYNFLRENSPVIFNDDGTVALSLYKDVSKILKSPHALNNVEDETSVPNETVVNLINLRKEYFFGLKTFFDIDGEDHLKMRSYVSDYFSKTNLFKYSEYIKETTIDTLSNFSEKDVIDIYSEVFQKIPLKVISHIIGVPEHLNKSISDSISAATKIFEPNITKDMADEIGNSAQIIGEFLLEAINYKKDNLSNDMLSNLIAEEKSVSEIMPLIITLYIAGHITTSYIISSSLSMLLNDKDAKDKYLEDPTNFSYLEELIRYDPPVHIIQRVAGQDFEVSNGGIISAGTLIYLFLASANRDPAAFTDPDKLLLDRDSASKNLSFAAGAHFCLGSHLTKMEMSIILSNLFNIFPNIQEIRLDMLDNVSIRQVKEFKVRL